MTTERISFLFSMLLSIVGTKAWAYDIAVENADGVTIYYNYINDGMELEVTKEGAYSGAVNIPETVTYMNRTRYVTSIGDYAFYGCSGLTFVTIPNSMTSIGGYAFFGCSGLTSVTIPNSMTSIGYSAFCDCSGLTAVHIMDLEAWCKISFGSDDSNPLSYAHRLYMNGSEITNLVIPNSVTNIGDYAFIGCSSLTSVTIPNSVTSIGRYVFYWCSSLTSVTIPNSLTSIGYSAFYGCSGLTSVTIPNSVTSIGNSAFENINLVEIVSLIETPFEIYSETFSQDTRYNATLYVPKGTLEKYKSTAGWKDFVFVEEGNGSGNNPSEPNKCEKPTISYQNGKLTFTCSTEGAICQSTITDTDITSYSSNEVQLGVTYNISVYATKEGYDNSETASAILCWIDVEPKTEGVENGIAEVRANAVIIKTEGGLLTIEGTDDYTNILVYTLDGVQVGSAISKNGVALVNTNITSNSFAIVKIGNKSVKVLVK